MKLNLKSICVLAGITANLFFVNYNVKAQPVQTLTIEKLWQLGRVSEPQLSADGKTVLYSVRHYDVKTNKSTNIYYLLTLATGQKKQITTPEVNAFSARFTPDGKKISYLCTKSGDAQIWEMNIDGTEITQLSFVRGGVSGYKYSPAMNKIAYTADVKLDNEVKDLYPDLDKCNARIIDGLFYRHWDSWHDYAYSHLFVADLTYGVMGDGKDLMQDEKFDCPLQPHGDDDEFNWSPDGTRIAYNSRKQTGTAEAISTNSDIYLYNFSTKQTINISASNKGYDKNPQFTPDGKKIFWQSMEGEGNESDLNRLVYLNIDFIISAKDKPVTLKPFSVLTSRNNFDYPIENFLISNDGKVVYFTAPYQGTKQLFAYNFDVKKETERIKIITVGDWDYGAFSVNGSLKSGRVVINKMSISMPAELFEIDLQTGKEKQITFTNKDVLNNVAMGEVRKRMVKTTDSADMLAWVIYPPNFDPNKKYPTLLYCQGGPQSALTQFFSYRWNFELMAANGYIVIAPNRRGMPGHGSDWNNQITGDYGGQCMRDYLSAIDDLCKESYVDKDKLGAVGASFGGFSVYWLAGNHNKRFKTFIAHCGMFNMESWYGTTEEMFFANHDNKGPYWSQTSHPNNFDASPHKFVQNWDAPMLVIHNEKDFRVPLGQGMEAFTAAQIKGIPSRFLYFPDENHWVTKPQNSVLWQRVFFDWLARSLK